MGRANRLRRAQLHKLEVKKRQIRQGAGSLSCVMWNCNGLMRDGKPLQIAEVFKEYKIDIMCISETHLRVGANEDLSCLSNHTLYFKEREGLSKKGGGLMTVVKRGVNHSRYSPPVPLFPYLDSEREWILIHEANAQIALCFVYCAAEIGGDEFKTWNQELMAMIQTELDSLKEQGYLPLLTGDFNAHVGNDSQGIPGNNKDINWNGRLVREFIHNNNLLMVNKDPVRCKGVFTRITSNSMSILDLVLENNADQLVEKLEIDEYNDVLGGSDHAALFLRVRIPRNLQNHDVNLDKEEFIRGPAASSADSFKTMFETEINLDNWDSLSTQEKCTILQKALLNASKKACSQITLRKPGGRTNKSVRALLDKCKQVEAGVKRLNKERLSGMFISPYEDKKFEKLDNMKVQAKSLRVALSCMLAKQRKRRRLRLALHHKLTAKQFWSLVRRVERKAGSLTAVADAEGRLATDKARIERIVLGELEKIFSGKRSHIFSHRGEQLVKELTTKDKMGWKEWIKESTNPNQHETKVCSKVSEQEVAGIINKLKLQRAPGVDGVTVSMLRYAGPLLVALMTDLVNQILREGQVPEALLVGKMTLIDKKQPSLIVTQKRPLTVSCVMLSVITKVLHGRMDKICESKGYYGNIQYGFRSGRSTSDCVFMLLAAIRKAKSKGHTISIAFCDIAKAYDSVNRELLYAKLDSLGFGGKVKALIQSMYYNDCVRVRIAGCLSAPLWFTRGVKQGCVLSPLLFALYVSGLGTVLHSMKEGVNFDGVVLSALFFADDLVLISRTKRRGMESMLRSVNRFCQGMDMKLAVEKTVMLTSGPSGTSWKVTDDNPCVEAVLVGKYLGIEIQVKGRNLIKGREGKMVSIAQKYANAVIGLSRNGLDRAVAAHALWERCAIPAILYCSESMVLSKGVLENLDRIQHMISRFILQLPRSSARIAGALDAGLMQMKDRVMIRTGMFVWNIMNKKNDRILKTVFDSVMRSPLDSWARQVEALKEAVGGQRLVGPKRLLKSSLKGVAVNNILLQKRELTSLACMPQPRQWFKLQGHVDDSIEMRTFNRVRVGDVGLGNRRPNPMGKLFSHCPYCLDKGVLCKLTEHHVIIECLSVSYERNRANIPECLANSLRSKTTLRKYLGEDNAGVPELRIRAGHIHNIIERWQSITTPF